MPDLAGPERRSPLRHRTPIEAGGTLLRMAERPFVGKFVLRAAPQEAVERLRSALGIGLPFDPLTSSTGNGASFLWLGPDEWMLVTEPAAGQERFRAAAAALAGTHHQLVDVSEYYTVIGISGSRAREALMKLTTIDLHPRAFRAGSVTGGVFGRVNAILWQTADDRGQDGPVFHLFVRWSMADYLWCLLANAGGEWGMPEQVPTMGEALTIA